MSKISLNSRHHDTRTKNHKCELALNTKQITNTGRGDDEKN